MDYLPKEPLDLPLPEKELPAHVSSHAPHPDSAHAHSSQTTSGIKTLLSWQAPGRPFRKRGKEYYLSVLLIMLLIEVVLFLFSEYMLMVAVISLVFLAFALATVPPTNFHYRISSEGITIEDHFFLWDELYDFYFKQRDGANVLHIRTHAFVPGELTLTLGDLHPDHVRSVVIPYLPYREVVKKTFMEKSGDWLAKNFPLERTAPAKS